MERQTSRWEGVRRFFGPPLNKIEKEDRNIGMAPAAEWKAEALADFSAWLADLPDTPPAGEGASLPACDLFTLLSEFSALRQEIKLQNREQHRTTQQLAEIHETFPRGLALFEKSIRGIESLSENIRLQSEKKAILPFLDVRDALVRGYKTAKAARDKRSTWYRPGVKGLEGIVEGYEMAIRRFDRGLSLSGISPIPAEGQPFDPKTMKAVGQGSDPAAAPGIVLEEHVGGFARGDEILRTAEVTVNGRPENGK